MGTDHHAVPASLNSVGGACDRLQISRANLYKLMDNGHLRSVKIGRRRLVPEQAIIDFIEALENADGTA